MKTTVVIALALLLCGAFYLHSDIRAHYEYATNVQSYWDLSVKASSLDVKAAYLDKFVAAIQAQHLGGNDAIIFKTPNNSYEQNMTALLSLQTRMHEIQAMDVRSFEYQQAMAQITAQEQGEATEMLDALYGVWLLNNHPLLWGWIEVIAVLLLVALPVVLLVGCAVAWAW